MSFELLQRRFQIMQRKWNVHVIREGRSQYIGEVSESSEEMARCAALSRFGVGADEIDTEESPPRCVAIYPDDDFEVSPAA
ncbi:hypothetical protein [Rhodoferax sp.]|jgi:hypothetical protein|uniref:hypothetical protein n=1 Tax=Rhodoferax sp. TaxID=50421 RepID=UPI0025FCBCEB|nr:hypothetical protein [Rhodoferax sp.]MCM2296788.1 hypothetical protein [Rhodoferax sp.]